MTGSRPGRLHPTAVAAALACALIAGHRESPAEAKVRRVFILSWRTADAGDVIKEGIRAGLTRGRDSVLIEEASCESDPGRADALSRAWEAKGADLVFAVGVEASKWALSRKSNIPVVSACSGAGAAVALSGDLAGARRPSAGVFLEPEAGEMIGVFSRFVPNLSRLGFLHARGCESAAAELAAARSASRSADGPAAGIVIVPRSVDQAEGIKGIESSFRSLCESGVQAVWLPDDSYLTSRIEALGDLSERFKMPLVASHPYGARRQTVAAISPGYRNLGIVAAAEGLRMIRTGENPKELVVTRSFHVVLNLKAAQRAGLVVPLESIVHADVIVDRDGW